MFIMINKLDKESVWLVIWPRRDEVPPSAIEAIMDSLIFDEQFWTWVVLSTIQNNRISLSRFMHMQY